MASPPGPGRHDCSAALPRRPPPPAATPPRPSNGRTGTLASCHGLPAGSPSPHLANAARSVSGVAWSCRPVSRQPIWLTSSNAAMVASGSSAMVERCSSRGTGGSSQCSSTSTSSWELFRPSSIAARHTPTSPASSCARTAALASWNSRDRSRLCLPVGLGQRWIGHVPVTAVLGSSAFASRTARRTANRYGWRTATTAGSGGVCFTWRESRRSISQRRTPSSSTDGWLCPPSRRTRRPLPSRTRWISEVSFPSPTRSPTSETMV